MSISACVTHVTRTILSEHLIVSFVKILDVIKHYVGGCLKVGHKYQQCGVSRETNIIFEMFT